MSTYYIDNGLCPSCQANRNTVQNDSLLGLDLYSRNYTNKKTTQTTLQNSTHGLHNVVLVLLIGLLLPSTLLAAPITSTITDPFNSVDVASDETDKATAVLPNSPARWNSPCSGSIQLLLPLHVVEGEGKTTPASPTSASTSRVEYIRGVVNRASEAKQNVYSLMQHYVNKRFADPLFPESLSSFRLEGMPYPEISDLTYSSTTQRQESLQNAYNNLSRVAVFMEQAIADEMKHEAEFGSSLHHEIQQVQERDVISFLCHLQLTLLAHESEVNLDVTHEIMHTKLRYLPDRAMRHTRDFIVLRDLKNLLHFIEFEFTQMMVL